MPIYGAGHDPDFRAEETDPIFGALGPLEVRAGDGLVHVGGPQIRTLLALLLARPGQVMSLSALVASLWSSDAPPSAERTVRTYMSRLRHALTPVAGRFGHGQLVVATPPGYLLRADPLSVDASRFEQLALAGRHALTRNDPMAARSHLGEALALWRGDAYAEFADVPLLRTEASRLEELRLNTVENRVQSELKLGLGSDLVAEMDALVSAHPLRERLWVQYMIALYRSGRQAEALSAYQRARAYLADELGLEPSGELADTHRKILAHDPELLPPVNSALDSEPLATVIAGRFGRRWDDQPQASDVGYLASQYLAGRGTAGRRPRPPAAAERIESPRTRWGKSPEFVEGESPEFVEGESPEFVEGTLSRSAHGEESDAGWAERSEKARDQGSIASPACVRRETGSACCAAAASGHRPPTSRSGRRWARADRRSARTAGQPGGWLARVLSRRCVRALVGHLSRRSTLLSRWLTSIAALSSVHSREWSG
ncbi:MAG: BTAD domain-containing putative transcriptional regulator [Jatrophihabitantaceae bacterium]